MTAGVCVAATAGGFVVGTYVRSPWEDAAANAKASVVVTAPVEWRPFLSTPVEAQGQVHLGTLRDVVPLPGGTTVRVVTAAGADVGDTLRSGMELLEVSGRPLIALSLPFDLYRDVQPGDSGADVRALQDALRTLGLYSLASDGEYGPATAAAVRQLYRDLGAEPPSPASDTVEAVDAAESALAEATIDEPATAGDEMTGPAGDHELSALRATLMDARRAADTPLPMAEIVALTSGTATVVSVAPVGSHLDGETNVAATLRAGEAAGRVRVSVADKNAFPAGAEVEVMATTDQTVSRTALVTSLSEFRPADEDSPIPGYDATLTFAQPEDVPFEDETQVIARVGPSAAPQEGLAVPLIAIRSDGDGTYVVVLHDGEPDRVGVAVETSSDGYALVSGSLRKGSQVVVSDAS